MKKIIAIIIALALVVWVIPKSFAAEHGGEEHKEHGGAEHKEHGGTAPQKEAKKPSADDIRAAMKDYVMEKSKATGTFDITDPETGTVRHLSLERIHERVGKTGNYYYSCADFKDTESGDMLDLDLDVQEKDGKLSVVDVRIHKLNGKERYTYDENDNRIPISTPEEQKKEHGGEEHKEHGGKESKEHGGEEHKEHGGAEHKEHGGN